MKNYKLKAIDKKNISTISQLRTENFIAMYSDNPDDKLTKEYAYTYNIYDLLKTDIIKGVCGKGKEYAQLDAVEKRLSYKLEKLMERYKSGCPGELKHYTKEEILATVQSHAIQNNTTSEAFEYEGKPMEAIEKLETEFQIQLITEKLGEDNTKFLLELEEQEEPQTKQQQNKKYQIMKNI